MIGKAEKALAAILFRQERGKYDPATQNVSACGARFGPNKEDVNMPTRWTMRRGT